jgi:replicative DNA helicase
MFQDVVEDQADPSHLEQYLRSITERSVGVELARMALKVADGLGSLEELKEFASALEVAKPSASRGEELMKYLVTTNINDLLNQTYKARGLRWRLGSLNKSLGSLRKGDFGFVFARPETGKTTFLASEMSYMVEQLKDEDGPIIWFNNEEQGGKVQIRCAQAVLGLTKEEAENLNKQDQNALQAEVDRATKNKLRIFDKKPITKQEVEDFCEHIKPSVIIFDQIDKITGFTADRNDLELKELYGWARELASQYGPVIAVCQAGGTGENKQWLTMNDVDSSKTSKQGEADWILGIGFVHEPGKEMIRYMNLSKNKLIGDEDTDPSLRHNKWACYLMPEIARYKDFNHDGTV